MPHNMKSLFLLASATIAFAANKFIKKGFEVEYAKGLSKREIPAQDLDENITLAQMRSVCLPYETHRVGLYLTIHPALLARFRYWYTVTAISLTTRYWQQ